MLWLLCLLAAPADNLTANAGLETLTDGYPEAWSRGWCRDGAEAIAVASSDTDPRSGERCLLIRHTGERDWAVNPGEPLAVRPGEIYELSVWVRIAGSGHVLLCAAVYPPGAPHETEEGVDWTAGGIVADGPTGGWVELRSRLVIAPGMSRAQPRVIGTGPVEAAIDDFAVRRAGSLDELRAGYRGPAELQLGAKAVRLRLEPNGTGELLDSRTGRRWRLLAGTTVATAARQAGVTAELTLLEVERGLALRARVEVR